MTSIKDQASCGSCWAFASVGAMEAQYQIGKGNPNIGVDLSEQNILSCSGGSCSGWYLDSTLNFLRDSGTPDEACDPYSGTQTSCGSGRCADYMSRIYKITGWSWIDTSASNIKNYIYTHGPVLVWMPVFSDFPWYDASFWQNYFYAHSTSGSYSGHFVVIVGWNDQGPGTADDYWIVRNSWGTSGGDVNDGYGGYFYMTQDPTTGFFGLYQEAAIISGVTPPNVQVSIYSVDLLYKGQDPASQEDIHGTLYNNYQNQPHVTTTTFAVPYDTQVTFSVSSSPTGWTFANQWDDYGFTEYNGFTTITINVDTSNHKIVAFFTYSTSFQQSGIPGGTTWGVTMGGTRYTSTGSTIGLAGLSGNFDYSFDSTVTASSGAQYVCVSGCSGSFSGPMTETANYVHVATQTITTTTTSSTSTLTSSISTSRTTTTTTSTSTSTSTAGVTCVISTTVTTLTSVSGLLNTATSTTTTRTTTSSTTGTFITMTYTTSTSTSVTVTTTTISVCTLSATSTSISTTLTTTTSLGHVIIPIQLQSGWNLVSLPVVPLSTSLTYLLKSQIAAQDISVVWSYAGTPRSWQSYVPGKGGTLTTMVDGNAYWIFMTKNDTLYVDGTVIPPGSAPPTYSLVQGWNLIGFKPEPTVQNETVGAYLSSITGSYNTNNVWVYDNSSQSWVRADASYALQPGQGIWILMTASATLRP